MTPWFETNLAALGSRPEEACRALAARLRALGPAAGEPVRDRQGQPCPTWEGRSLVSTFNPTQEAERWAAAAHPGAVAVLGGAGAEADRALVSRGATLRLWVEPRLEVWQALVTWQDWGRSLADPGWLPAAGPPDETSALLKARYLPAWEGGFQTLAWRAAAPEALGAWSEALAGALADLTGDFSTQAKFAERWYRQTLINLQNLGAAEVSLGAGARVAVTGAGPSLADALDDPAHRQWLEARPHHGGRVWATDTSWPALAARGVAPDAVFSLDGQLASYHHFAGAGAPPCPVVADLAALPLLDRLGVPVVRYLSGHPLGTVVRRGFPDLPVLDAGPGHVGGLTETAAWAQGADQVDCWGIDLAYRNGQTYASGTYGYDLAHRRADRLVPSETRLTAPCYGAAGRERTFDPQGRAWDTTPLLRAYRRAWSPGPKPARPQLLGHAAAGSRWDAWASDWRRRLDRLPLPPRPEALAGLLLGLPRDQAEDWAALLPLALALARIGVPRDDLAQVTVDRARSFLI